jgi:hypothetical protein
VIRPPISPRLAANVAALLALVLIPGSAQAVAGARARLAASYARWIGRPVPAPPPLRYAD